MIASYDTIQNENIFQGLGFQAHPLNHFSGLTGPGSCGKQPSDDLNNLSALRVS